MPVGSVRSWLDVVCISLVCCSSSSFSKGLSPGARLSPLQKKTIFPNFDCQDVDLQLDFTFH